MPKKIKKILTEDDLIKFCQSQKFSTFSSKDTGYQLAIKVPTTFEVDDNVDANHRDMLRIKIKIFHTGINRNNSKVSKEAAEKAMLTIPDRPILAAIHQLSNGEYDFAGHEMELVHNEETGEDEIRYIESQVGSFSSEPAFWEHDDELDKDFVCAYAYISRQYTKAAEILERKGFTKNSCELCIDELSYDGNDHCLDLLDFYVSASTLLGTSMDGNERPIEEGMQGSRADIADFSVENNSVKFSKDEKLIELLDKLNTTLSNFNNNNSKKGGENQSMTILDTLLTKYNKTVEDITFEYKNLSEDELTAKFEEVFGESDDEKENVDNTDNSTDESNVDENTDNIDTDNSTDENDSDKSTTETVTENNACGGAEEENSEDNSDEDTEVTEENACGGGSGSTKKKKKNSVECSYTTANGETKTYAISLDKKISAIHCLVNDIYADADNTYYGVKVYDSYVIMEDWCTGRYYKQTYTDENDVYTLTGDRVEVYAEFVTKDELDELQSMRSNYSSIVEQLNEYKSEKDFADKMTVFDDDAYADYLDTEEFKALMSKESVNQYSKEQLSEKADATLGKLVKKNKTFSYSEKTEKQPTVVFMSNSNSDKESKKKVPYGGIFEKYNK